MSSALLRIVVCGAVDDGKSTVLGRLLVETNSIPLDEIDNSRLMANGEVDYSQLTDGLESEREQGITIDVAHRHVYLPSGRRAILADSPGHEQYTRNMAVAASEADVGLLLVDAVKGVRDQSVRHAAINSLMGVKHIVVAVNKMDAVGYDKSVFDGITEELARRFEPFGFEDITYIPVSGMVGDNVTVPSDEMTWGNSVTILSLLDQERTFNRSGGDGSLRLPVQFVSKAGDVRWYAGTVARGTVTVGDTVRVWPAMTEAVVAGIYAPNETKSAGDAQAVHVTLDREVDIARGDVIVGATGEIPSSRAHLADLVWIDTKPLDTHASYILRSGPIEIPARVETVRYVRDITTGEQARGRALEANDIGRVEIVTDRPILLDPYAESLHTGGFILVDRLTAVTVAAGMSKHPLVRESDVVKHDFAVDRAEREKLNGLRSCVLWLTGLPGSGKSTVADELEKSLMTLGLRSFTLDGDTVRSTLSEDLGFSPEDRKENVRRVARVAELMMDAGIVVIVSLVSPFRDDREMAKERFADGDFIEVFVDTPLEVCMQRDPKGLYARSQADKSMQMTGVGQDYEAPLAADVTLDGTQPVEDSVQKLLSLVLGRRI
ncbi:MAG: adenylyl-sulfate kinase [Microbacteriaceae bacterium]|nr:adenylyl-sulfate kinase [Microbacteriaceae bacterium]